MAARKVNLELDEALVRRVRQIAIGAVGMSDAEVIEDALAVYLTEKTNCQVDIENAAVRGSSAGIGRDQSDP
jgi:hypothetical protein